MQLTTFTDYGVRSLIYIGLSAGERCTIDEIAAAYRISRHHLTKVIQELGRLGYVSATRGKFGGLSLAMGPDEIKVGEVIRQLEGDSGLLGCFRNQESCPLTPACLLKGALGKAERAFYEVLNEYTVSDLMKNGSRLRSLLSAQTD